MKRKGQLQIAEMLVAATILMVFILTIISVSINITPPPDVDNDEIKAKNYSILELADDRGLLRPAIYEFGVNNDYINNLALFIDISLPEYMQFEIQRTEIVNNSLYGETVSLYSSGHSSSNVNTVLQVNYLLTGYYSHEIIYSNSYQVSLITWRNI